MSLETVKVVNSDISRSAAIEQLSGNDQSLKGAILSKGIDKEILSTLYTQLGYTSPYIRDLSLGHTLSTYTLWEEYSAQAGYSIFKYPVSNFADGVSNLLLVDSQPFVYQGEAASLALTSFNSVLKFEVDTFEDVTTEAASELGTSFCFTSDYDGNCSWIYVGSCSIFNSIEISQEQVGSNYDLQLEVFTGSSFTFWDGSCSDSYFIDTTDNLHSDGRLSWENTGNSWTQTIIDSKYGYWARLSSSTKPTVVSKLYNLLPGNSVATLLKLSSTEFLGNIFKWCYFNGYVYVTLLNTSDPYYQGITWIAGASTAIQKKNYFVYNHEFVTSYLNSSATSSSYMKIPTWTVATRPSSPSNGMIAYNSDIDQVEIYINGEYRTMA